MDSTAHAIVGAAVSTAGIAALVGRYPPLVLAGLWVYGVLLSVFVDLDHFLIARVQTGDWSHLRGALSDPARAFRDPGWVFPDLSMPFERLLTHSLIGGALAVAGLLVAPSLGAFTAAVLYVHVVADLVHEIRHARTR